MTEDVNRLMDDANIKGGSPTDRIIGMLLERTEAIRELHDAMRQEFRGLIDTHTEIKNMMERIVARQETIVTRQETHETNDHVNFAAVNASNASIGAKIDSLSAQINAATTSNLIQKAQFNAGWKVIVVIGGIATGLFAIFAIFFNHNWK